MAPQKSKKGLIALIAVLLSVIIVIGVGTTALYMSVSKKDKAVVIDKTVQTAGSDKETSSDPEGEDEPADTAREDDEGYSAEVLDKLDDLEDDDNAIVFTAGVSVFADDSGEEINEAVVKLTKLTSGIKMDIEDGTDFEDIGIGDVFFLDGGEDTPFGEPYIGKISSVEDGDELNSYVIETPTFDEVFDVLKLDLDETLTPDDITSIQAMPGVTFDIDEGSSSFGNASSSDGDTFTVSKLDDIGSGKTELCDDEGGLEGSLGNDTADVGVKLEDKGIHITFNVDLLEAFGKKDDSDVDFQEVYDEASNHDTVKVYTTATGSCYHRETCMCLSKSKIEMKLKEAVDEGFDVCFLCNPPLYKKEGKTNLEKEFTLSGQFGLENLDLATEFDWDILAGEGINDLGFSVAGDFTVDVDLNLNGKFELGAPATSFTAPYNVFTAKGLDQKMFPLLFISYNGAFNAPIFGKGVNDKITAVTAPAPLTVGVIVYIDVSGNVTLSSTLGFDYDRSFSAGMTIYEDGKFVGDLTGELSEGKPKVTFNAELKGDADIHFGCSANLYVFNINPLEISIIRLGTEAEGGAKLALPDEDGGLPFSGSFNLKLYLKLIGVDLNIKAKVDLGPIDGELGLNEDWLWKNITLHEWGTKNPTRYSDGTMSYSHITAKDESAIYYKDTDGALVKESNSTRTKLFDGEFFSICGIDSSYIYLLQHDAETGYYEMRRVSKTDGAINKKIADDVVNCLTFDDSSIYYVESFNKTQILKLDRNTLEDEVFCDLDSDAVYMEKRSDNFYVMRADNSSFSSFFGGGPYCMLVNSDGDIIEDYGQYPSVSEYSLSEFENYTYAVRLVSQGYLRNSASEVHWAKHDFSSTVNISCASGTGWNPHEEGVFTIENVYSTSADSTPYKIVLYSGIDGTKSDVTGVHSGQALFTLCKSDSGDWYFFDQTSTELILYRMSEDFSSKTVIKTFSLEDMNVDLTNCGMQLMDNRIYFYTMPDGTTSTVLYRYDLV